VKLLSGKPILVTGGPRTATTWVGRVIAQADPVHYIHEPFNIDNRPCVCGHQINYWFQYVSSKNASTFENHFSHQLWSPFHFYNLMNLVNTYRIQRSPRETLRAFKNFTISIFKSRPLIKDPLAVFSADWLASKFNADVLVLIRHPAAFVSSYKKLNWLHPLSHFLDQPALMRDHLSPFEEEIREYERNEADLVGQAALLWKLIYFRVLKYKEDYPNWIFVRHEDLSLNPHLEFQKIFNQLGVEFSRKVINKIEETIHPQNPIDSENPYSIHRNSAENLWKWKNQLSSQEIERVATVVDDIVGEFYSEDYWKVPEAII
jgi:hypothetical protein